MKILVIGSGGREHALVWKLARASPKPDQAGSRPELWCAPGNGGIAGLARCVEIPASDIAALKKFVLDKKIDLTVVGPEEPLVLGIADEFKQAGLAVFGPEKRAARLEGDKAFAKTLMRDNRIPTARFEIFTEPQPARAYIDRESGPWVVKAAGLALGKGVTVCRTRTEAYDAVDAALIGKIFGPAGETVVIEECLRGEEASIVALIDGETIVPLLAAQDHKAVFDGDRGPNTGGMGAFAPAPVVDRSLLDLVIQDIMRPVLRALGRDGVEYRGALYAGLMLTERGPRVLEFNCRLGDPETQSVLALLESDLTEVLCACVDGRLRDTRLDWFDRSAVTVVAASPGYPGPYEKGKPIVGDLSERDGVVVFHAGTKSEKGRLVTNGGRVLGVTGIDADLGRAQANAYRALGRIRFEGMHFRTDIGDRALPGRERTRHDKND